MSPRRSRLATAVIAAGLLAGAGGTVHAQADTIVDPGSRCLGWGAHVSVSGDGGSDVLPIGECSLPVASVAEVSAMLPSMGPLLEQLPIDELDFQTDPGADAFILADGSVPGEGDPATEILGSYHATFALDRRSARSLGRWLSRQLPADSRATFGQPVNRLIRPGEWEVTILHTAADPTTSTPANRVWQIGFQGAQPESTVAPTIPETNPLAGSRHLASYGQFLADGEVRLFAAMSDFGSDRLGPDGQSQYYNAPPRIFAIMNPDGVAIVTPTEIDPIGYRPMAFAPATETWDVVSAPGGPFAFVPADGTAPGLFDFASLILAHEPMPDQSFVLDGAAQSGVTLPSGNYVSAISQISHLIGDPGGAQTWSLGLDVDGHDLAIDGLVDAATPGDGHLLAYGIPTYGRYCIRGATPLREGMTWSDGTAITAKSILLTAEDFGDDLARSLGTRCWMVGEQAGMLNDAAVRPWFDPGLAPYPYDAEAAAALLEEAGWVLQEDGVRAPVAPSD
jgi:hypothetical protein